ncbi:S8 family peptidase [Paludisphaera borealis]|uniref:Peptidase s8 n=1 Tax=Paludisphaera borealis TaxID=1387353 RepID=A0A1U7CZJ3_9BACT|nr:S8 family peptidase [Paludisphaera borealis]APW64308.1 peptidase s8 [Paludisphaera borealis]
MARLRHFLIQGTAQAQNYVSTGGGSSEFKTPPRDARSVHGPNLAANALQAATDMQAAPERPAEGISFVPIAVTSDPGFKLWLESLDNKVIGSEIINFRYEADGSQRATVHIPKDNVAKFAKKFEDYAHKTNHYGNPPNASLAESIRELRLAMLSLGDYWTDSGPPPPPDEEFWWEVWLRDEGTVTTQDGRELAVEENFREEAESLGIRVSNQQVRFPDYVVVLAYASLATFSDFPGLLRYLGEFRRASIVPTEYMELTPAGQTEFILAMLERTTFADSSAPAVCLLDRGVNRGHPLLEHALVEEHNLAWDDDWDAADRHGHGTGMAGLILYGSALNRLLVSDHRINLKHGLEAVKILPDAGANDPPDYGPITVGSIAKMEIEAPDRLRVICMAITAGDKEQWAPTLWSAALDQMCSGATDDVRRLMLVSAGNYEHDIILSEYPQANHSASVQDPSQAWNVVTVGAYTDRAMITSNDFAGYNPIAKRGSLCPSSTTSCGWTKREWPLKPDIVMEGGNYAHDPSGQVWDVEDLALLTTTISPDGALLTTTRDTSAATALAARYAAILQAEYPTLWPESVRGLLIHSARWTERMLEEFPHPRRQDRLRCYGYGVPNLSIARQCASRRATMIIQDSLQPFCWDEGKNATKTNQMHVHNLPWPIEALQDLGDTPLRMRVTLSYFIEPSPGRKGWNVKHRYQSHGLRFAVKRPQEDMGRFMKRLTRDAWDEGNRPSDLVSDTRNWNLGEDLRTKGSIHSDYWDGTAAELAACGFIAVHPITGWWRERPSHRCFDKLARYSLIVTLYAHDPSITIYDLITTAIANRTDIVVTV